MLSDEEIEAAIGFRLYEYQCDTIRNFIDRAVEDAIAKRDANWQSIMTAAIERCFGKDDKRITELKAHNKQLLEALKLAVDCHGKMLLSNPPQDAWLYHRVEERARAAIAAVEGKHD